MLTPDEILTRTGKSRIQDRIRSLMYFYRKIRHRFPGTRIDATLCYHLVGSYFADLERLKVFHDTVRADDRRKAAFTMKWIAKVRPIQIEEGCAVTKAVLLANEVFAITAGLICWKMLNPFQFQSR